MTVTKPVLQAANWKKSVEVDSLPGWEESVPTAFASTGDTVSKDCRPPSAKGREEKHK